MADTGQILTWQDQVCVRCGGELFTTLVKIRAKAGGGFTTQPGGYACHQCGVRADVAKMQQAALRQQRLQELRALESEMQEQETPATLDVPVPPISSDSWRS